MRERIVRWERLYSVVARGLFTVVDYLFADEILRQHPDIDESVAVFLCYLMSSARSGHLCVTIEAAAIMPLLSPAMSVNDGDAPINYDEIVSSIIRGAHDLPGDIIEDVSESYVQGDTPLCRSGANFYLRRHWMYETMLLEGVRRLMTMIPERQCDMSIVNARIEALFLDGALLPEQIQAIRNAVDSCFTVIVGGPGTGKTYTARILAEIVKASILGEESLDIVVAAPTGKAAANLRMGIPDAEAKTLHAILGKGYHSRSMRDKIGADIIIVDECSMVDLSLMAELFSAVANGARIILLGDSDQLPSVEAGSVFADIVENIEGAGNVTRLTTCLRAESSDIIALAHAINAGTSKDAVALLRSMSSTDMSWGGDSRAAKEALLKCAFEHYPTAQDILSAQNGDLFRLFGTFRMLSPLRKGLFGVDSLNSMIFSELSREAYGMPFFAAPIMITTNDYAVGMMNGDVGVLIMKGGEYGERRSLCIGDYALFPGMSEEQSYYDSEIGMRKIPALVLPQYEYAYCISVHKSQGSEFDHIMLVMPPGAACFGKEVLYTAVTRARKTIDVVGDEETIYAALEVGARRRSGISSRYRVRK